MVCTLPILSKYVLMMLTHIFIADLANMIRFHVDNRILRSLLIKILSCPRNYKMITGIGGELVFFFWRGRGELVFCCKQRC